LMLCTGAVFETIASVPIGTTFLESPCEHREVSEKPANHSDIKVRF